RGQPRPVLEGVLAGQAQGPGVQPAQFRLETSGSPGWGVSMDDGVATRHVDIAIQHHRDGRAGSHFLDIAVEGDEFLHPGGNTGISSPRRSTPLASCPMYPRKSSALLPPCRETSCTGKRIGRWLSCLSSCKPSRSSSKAGPSYQGVRSEAVTTLSPLSADM